MLNRKLLLLLLSLFSLVIQAAQVFDPNEEYLITCYDTKTGGIEVATSGSFPLMYNSSVNKNTERVFWKIKEEQSGKYSIKNTTTNQYIGYLADNYDSRYIKLVSALDAQNSTTLFTFNPVTKDGLEYYAIVSVANPEHIFNKRGSGVVGTFECKNRDYDNNELFILKKKSSLPAEFQNGNGRLSTYLNSITLNGNSLALDETERIYYYSLPLSQINTDVDLKIEFETKSTNYTLKLDGQEFSNGTLFTFNNVEANKQYEIKVFQNGSVTDTEYLIFTGLPIVQLYSTNTLSDSFQKGQICVHEPDKSIAYELFDAEIRYRGASSLSRQKKAFAIKVKDTAGKNLDVSFFGLREDKYWILDAMAVDKGRVRNRVCTDLWNDFSAAPYHKSSEPEMVNATRGLYVEVFLNDKYWGLYCMTERVDRKQLKLKKFKESPLQVRGVLYKTFDWSYAGMMGYVPRVGPNPNYSLASYSNSSLTWDGHEMEYPDVGDGEPIDWKPLYDVVKFVAQSSNTDFINNIAKQVDLPVWLDYYLMMELILATDNHGKNEYLYMYDITGNRMLGIAPWDMDGTLGRTWGSGTVAAAQDYTRYIINNEHGEHNLFRRLKETNASGFNDLLKKQYDKFRFTYFSPESLSKRFEDYKNLFDQTGATTREIKRWNGADGISLNFDEELAYLKKWVVDRSNYLNQQYGPPESIDNSKESVIAANYLFYPNPVSGTLNICNVVQGTPVLVYSQYGTLVYSQKAEETNISVDFSDYPSGCYYLKIGENRGKVIMKY